VSSRAKSQATKALAFIAIPYLAFVAAQLYPGISALRLSFYDASPIRQTWAGFENYRVLWHDPIFRKALYNTLRFGVVLVPGGTALSLGLALSVHPLTDRWRGFFRGAFYFPTVVSGAVMVAVFSYIAEPMSGLLNYFLVKASFAPINWLGSPKWAWIYLSFVAIIEGIGGSFLVFLIGLDTVPKELVEAAEMDGAGAWARFRHVRLPSMWPIFLFVLVTRTIGALSYWEGPWLYTEGGPMWSTVTPGYYIYYSAFSELRFGMASAVGVVQMLLVAGFVVLQMTMRRRG
jgi:ABC-type sugar transport system permease subunit